MKIVNEINDHVFKKYFLQECSIFKFKQKFKIYDKLRFDYDNVKSHKPEVDARLKLKPEKP